MWQLMSIDELYYGQDNPYLTKIKSKNGTNKAIRFASIDAVVDNDRFTLSIFHKWMLDGISKGKEVELLLKKAMEYVSIGIDEMLRG